MRGANRLGYNETYYFGRPGAYQHFVCGWNDAGIPGFGALTDPSIGQIDHWPISKSETDSVFDEKLTEFRRSCRVNTWMVLSPDLLLPTQAGVHTTILWPDSDSLRTFVDRG